MKRIAIARVRARYDVAWHASDIWYKLIGLMGDKGLEKRLREMEGQPFIPQLTLPYLAGLGKMVARQNNLDIEFKFMDDYVENLRPLLKKGNYDMVMFSVNTPSAPDTYLLSEELMAMGIQTMMGGIHASMMPHEAAKHTNSVAMGEAEPIMEQILKDFYEGQLKPLYRGGRARDMLNHPMPDWKASANGNYCPEMLPVETSRGCKNACEFCATTRFQGPKRRHRPIEDVVEEIKFLKKEGILTHQPIFFTDNNIVSDSDYRRGIWDTEYARKLFEALIPLEITWIGQGELDVGDDLELTKLMARSGCETLLIGLESLDEAGLDHLGKGCNHVDKYINQIETLHSCGISISGSFIVGLDSDRAPETFDNLLNFVDNYIDVPDFCILTPYPGTKLYRTMEKQGRLLHKDWSFYDIGHVVYKPANMTPEELEHNLRNLIEKTFSIPRIMQRAMKHAMRNPLPNTTHISKIDRFTGVLSGNIGYRQLHKDCCRPSTRWFRHDAWRENQDSQQTQQKLWQSIRSALPI